MKNPIMILLVIIFLLILGFIVWLTGGSPAGFLAGVFLLLAAGTLGAAGAKILVLPQFPRTILGWVVTLCLGVIIWTSAENWWNTKVVPAREAKARAEAVRRTENAQQQYQPAPRREVTPIKTRKIFERIPASGLRVYLRQGWESSPLGGAITFQRITEEGEPLGDPIRDEPGVLIRAGYMPDGLYLVMGDPVGSPRGVRIHNYWGETK